MRLKVDWRSINFRRLALSIALSTLYISAKAVPTTGDELISVLAPTKIQESTTKNILDALREQHYVDQVLNDDVSGEVFDGYIDDLDLSLIHI